MAEKTKAIRRKKNEKKHIVVFQDANKKIFRTLSVTDGEAAEAPPMKSVQFETKHHQIIFAGWDKDLTCVQSNLVVHPIYQEVPKEYLVMYFHENGKILGTETVKYGEDAKADILPVKEETEEFLYHFEGWNCELSRIDGDRMAKAQFRAERKKFPVRFYGDGGRILQEEIVFFGENAEPPKRVVKRENPSCYYYFTGWDQSCENVRGPLNLHPVFRSELKEYRIRFYEEDNLIREKWYHYNDMVEYPHVRRKGYDFRWEDPVELVKESVDIHGSYVFSNPRGRQIRTEKGLFEIVNPSSVAGSVRLLEYYSDEEVIRIPETVSLNDYYYRIEYIHREAFRGCLNVKKIICSDAVRVLERNCFTSGRKLQEIVIGKNVRQIDEAAFGDCRYLKKLVLNSRRNLKLNHRAFDRMNHRVLCVVPADRRKDYEKRLAQVIREKEMILSTVL